MRVKFLLTIASLNFILLSYPQVSYADLDSTVQDRKREIHEAVQLRRDTIQEIADDQQATVQENVQERSAKIGTRQAEMKDRIKKRQEDAKARIASRREAFRAKLLEIKDARKRAVVERINNKLSAMNERATTRMLQALEKLSSHLDRFEQKTQDAKDKGLDTSTVDSAIADAKAAIASAQSAVEEQAGKVYVLEIGDEDTLRSTVGQTVRTMKSDLRATWGTVKDAKQAVVGVVRALAKVKNSAGTAPTETTE